MDPQTKDLILNWLRQAGEAIKHGAQFVVDQTPLVIQEKIAFARAENTIWLLVSLLLFLYVVGMLYNFVRIAKKYKDTTSLYSGVDFAFATTSAISGGVAVVIACVTFTNTISPFLKVWFAPRVYILEWILGGLK